MLDQFIPLEEALALKELGFDEDCFGYYENDSKKLLIVYNNLPLTEKQRLRPRLFTSNNQNSELPQWATSAPLWQQAFDWFVDNYQLDSYRRQLTIDGNCYWKINKLETEDKIKGYSEFSSDMNQCKLQCLKKLIEIIKIRNNDNKVH